MSHKVATPTLTFSANERLLVPPFAFPLRAGPVELDFVDGDLRHLRAHGEELIRRVTFNVRHHRWDTAAWRVDSLRLQREPESFLLHYSAHCEVAGTPYGWIADITGEPDGTITFHVIGEARVDSAEFRRAGLDVLYANPEVLGQPFETTHPDGRVAAHRFPELVPPHHLPAMDFTRIAHRTRAGAVVSTEIAGSVFGLEDQRVAGDDSFKAFSGLRHTYTPMLKAGDRSEKTLTLRYTAPAKPAPRRSKGLTFASTASVVMPELGSASPQADYGVFHELTRGPRPKTEFSWT